MFLIYIVYNKLKNMFIFFTGITVTILAILFYTAASDFIILDNTKTLLYQMGIVPYEPEIILTKTREVTIKTTANEETANEETANKEEIKEIKEIKEDEEVKEIKEIVTTEEEVEVESDENGEDESEAEMVKQAMEMLKQNQLNEYFIVSS